MKKLLALCATLLLFTPAHAKLPGGTGTTYYVNALIGNDSNNGTSQATPWQTIDGGAMNGHTFNCGDSVLFAGGQTFTSTIPYGTNAAALFAIGPAASGGGGIVNLSASCGWLNPFTFGSYGNGRAIINTSVQGAFFKGIIIWDTGGVIVRDLIVTSTTNGTSGTTGININSDQSTINYRGFLITNVDVSNFGGPFGAGISAISNNDTVSTGHLISNVTVSNSVIHNNNAPGVTTGSNTSAVQAGRVYPFFNIVVDRVISSFNITSGGSGNACGHGIDITDAESVTITRSVVHDDGGAGSGCGGGPVGIIFYEVKQGAMVWSEAYNIKSNGVVDGDCFDFDGGVQNSLMEYSYGHGCGGAGILNYNFASEPNQYGNVERYNILENNVQTANNYGELFFGTDGAANVISIGPQAYGNTIYNSGTNPLVYYRPAGQPTGALITNNVLWAAGTNRNVDSTANPAGTIVQGNDYPGGTLFRWNNTAYTTIATFVSGASLETYRGSTTALSASPSLTNPGNGGTCNTTSPPTVPLTCPSAYKIGAGSGVLNLGQNVRTVFGAWPGLTDYFGNSVPAPSSGNYDVGAHQRTQ